MKDEAKKIVEAVAKNHFWFEDRQKEPRDENDRKIYLDQVFVVVCKRYEYDAKGKPCDMSEVKFVPLKINKKRTKMLDLVSGEELAITNKHGRVSLNKMPEELGDVEKNYSSFELMNFTHFFAVFGDFCRSAFPKVDFTKIYNFARMCAYSPDVTASDIKTLVSGTENSFKKSEKARLKKEQKTSIFGSRK